MLPAKLRFTNIKSLLNIHVRHVYVLVSTTSVYNTTFTKNKCRVCNSLAKSAILIPEEDRACFGRQISIDTAQRGSSKLEPSKGLSSNAVRTRKVHHFSRAFHVIFGQFVVDRHAVH